MIQTSLNRINSNGSNNANPNNANALQLSVQQTKLKQSIASLQQQIASQQAIYMHKQSMNEMIGNLHDMNIKVRFKNIFIYASLDICSGDSCYFNECEQLSK